MFKEQLGSRLRKTRQDRGLSQEELCRITGLSRKFLGQIELGKSNVSLEKLILISKALNISLTSLFSGIDPVQDQFSSLVEKLATFSDAQSKQLIEQILSPKPIIALVGLRGSGKTTVGTKVSEELNIPFIQTDRRLEDELNMSLSNIFYLYGVEQYRNLSLKILQNILQTTSPLILEVGDSLLMEPNYIKALKEKAIFIWLKATPEDHIQRIASQGHIDLSNDTNRIETILEERTEFYEQADYTLNTSELGLENSCQSLSTIIKNQRFQ